MGKVKQSQRTKGNTKVGKIEINEFRVVKFNCVANFSSHLAF